MKSLYSNRLFMSVLTGVILTVIGGIYYLNHLENERTLEKERNIRLDYKQWHLPEGAKARIGAGTIRAMQYSPDGKFLAVTSDIGVWILDAQTAEPQHLLAPHTGVINSTSFSSDGKILAVGTENGTAQIWDTVTGEHLNTFTRREYYFGIDKVFIMPDSHTLVVVSSHSTMVDLWDIAIGERKKILSTDENGTTDDHVKYIPDMYMNLGGYINTFSSDGKTIVSYSSNETFRFWDITTRKDIKTLKPEPSGYISSFSSDLRTLAIARYKKPIHLWDVNSGTQKKTIKTDKLDSSFLVFSPNGNLLASYDDNAICIWDINTNEEKKKFIGHKNTVTTVAFSPDNRTLASLSRDNTLRFWDIGTGQEKKTVAGYGNSFSDVSLSSNGETLMSIGFDSSTIRLWDAHTGQHAKNLIWHKNRVWDAALSPDGSKLASNTEFERKIQLWDVNTGKLSKLKGPKRHVSGIAFSRDGETLASWGVAGNHNFAIQHWDVRTGNVRRNLQLTNQDGFGVPEDLYFDEKIFAGFGKLDSNLFVWDLVTGGYKIINEDSVSLKKVIVARFSPDGRVLAIVLEVLSLQAPKTAGNIVLQDVETGAPIRTLTGHTDKIECLAFSTDNRTLASGSKDKTIRLWDIETGSSRVVTDPSWTDNYRMYAGVASKLAFSPDGKTLAIGMKRGDVHLWEIATGAKKKTLRGHSQQITHIFFSADSQTLISTSDDGTILIWDLTHPQN